MDFGKINFWSIISKLLWFDPVRSWVLYESLDSCQSSIIFGTKWLSMPVELIFNIRKSLAYTGKRRGHNERERERERERGGGGGRPTFESFADECCWLSFCILCLFESLEKSLHIVAINNDGMESE